MASHKVGGEVDAFCTKCRMTLAHTILAMVGTKIARVRCNTCAGEHVYRTEAGSKTAAARSARAARPAKVILSFEQQLQGKDLAKARRYSPQETFAAEDLVNHPTFGLGLVSAVRGDKVDIAFKASSKTLIHARGGGAPAARPAFHARNAASASPADKPTPEAAPAQAAVDEVVAAEGDADLGPEDVESEPTSHPEE